jgi:diguanylate cyclase (GGDEF)-like protein
MSGPIRFGIAARLGILLAVVGLLTAGVTGFYAYEASRALLVQAAKKELLHSTQMLARRISLKREDITRTLTVLATHPAAIATLQKPQAAQHDQLATVFRGVMQANPGFFQLRLISANDHGLERVRVDRDGAGLMDITGDDLQEKSHFPYVFDTLKLPAGATYLSRIEINHEHGAHAGLGQPTVILAMTVVSAQGQTLGVIVVNVDLDGFFAQLAAEMPKEYELFMVNQRGDFLIHPDPTRTFGFDKGRRILVQDEFAETADLVAGKVDRVLAEVRDGRYAQAPAVVAFLGRKIGVKSNEESFIVGVAQPLAAVLRQSDQLGVTMLQIVAALCLVCILLAVLLARFIARPINAMSVGLQHFTNGGQVVNLPIDRHDEVGMLARSFDQMQRQINLQFTELQESRQEFEHLARHDMLTGLPNRRLFQDRLDHALARARRSGKKLALLFIDLDRFKEINDKVGHDAGDAVLKAVATRLAAATREADTVARLGGDEFVVLLDDPSSPDQIAAIAQKLLDGLKPEIQFQSHMLHAVASIGISQYPQDGETATEILANADRAMYQAKAAGRNCYRFFSQAAP